MHVWKAFVPGWDAADRWVRTEHAKNFLGTCSVQTFTGVLNKNNAIVLNHLIATRLSEGPSIPNPPQLHFLRPLSTPGSYLLAGLPHSVPSRLSKLPSVPTPDCISTLSRLYSLPSCLCWVVDVSLRIIQHASARGKICRDETANKFRNRKKVEIWKVKESDHQTKGSRLNLLDFPG